MRNKILLILAFVVSSCAPVVVWEEVQSEKDGFRAYAFDLKGLPTGQDWVLYFTQMPNTFDFSSADGLETVQVQGPLYKIYPTESYKSSGHVRVICHCAEIRRLALAPQGAYIRRGGRARQVEMEVRLGYCDDGGGLYEANSRYEDVEVSRFDVIPQIKQLTLSDVAADISSGFSVGTEAGFGCGSWLKDELERIGLYSEDGIRIDFAGMSGDRQGAYAMAFHEDCLEIACSDREGAFSSVATLISILENGPGDSLSLFEVYDYPDMEHRGAMVDVARNFTGKKDLLLLLDELSRFKVNRLHFHFCDDEGWRIEIAELPELTEVGAFHLPDDEPLALLPSYNGIVDGESSADGFYTEEDFVEILRHAADRGISIIPEIESPGHARAAIVAMRKRGDLRLDDPDDRSVYYSAQAYTDNVMNVASENTYHFMEVVISALERMYDKAGVPFVNLHIGGDEVPAGAWEGSPAVAAFMESEGIGTIRDLKTYFVMRMAKICKDHGLKMSGWQEMPLHINRDLDAELQEVFGFANCWNTVPEWGDDEIPYHLANLGYGVVLSNVCNAYCDLAYTLNRDEPGLNWAGTVNLEKAFALRPYDSYRSARYTVGGARTENTGEGKEPLLRPEMIKGVQTQLFAETVRSFDDVTYMMFPKSLGVFERGWNSYPAFGEEEFYHHFSKFSSIIYGNYMPRWQSFGFACHIGQPGLKIEDGMLYANSQYPSVVIRYTLDGSEPSDKSPIWTEPVPIEGAKVIKAKSYYLARASLTSQISL